MAGRGGGRGRGRGSMSFNIEQLGFTKGEALPGPVTQPPPLFPPLENKPVPLIKDVEQEYMLVVQKHLNVRFRNSLYYLVPTVKRMAINQYCDRLQTLSEKKEELAVQWNRFPAELKEKVKALKRKRKTVPSQALKKNIDPSKLLSNLEERENLEDDVNEEKTDKKGKDEEDEEEKPEAEEMEEDEEVDEELDAGTDYVNAYFDNGEAYLDEDDNLDDEPVY